jgi:hypothetical protein
VQGDDRVDVMGVPGLVVALDRPLEVVHAAEYRT